MKTLFINACVRKESRTLQIANEVLKKLGGEVEEVNLEKEGIAPLDSVLLAKRDGIIAAENWDDPMMKYAVQFASADEIVIAAPYWDLGFPALLKIYLEAIAVSGITFYYDNGIPKSLCKAKRLTYVTTAGGPIFADFGFSYVKTLAEGFYGITDIKCISAQGLDIYGADVDAIVKDTIASINEIL